MRRIGTLTDKTAADQFALYVRARGLECRRDETARGTEFWLYDESHLGEMRVDLDRYQRGAYTAITPPKVDSPTAASRRRPIRLPGFLQNLWGLVSPAPWTIFICAACVAATLLTGFFQVPTQFSRALAIIPLNVKQGGGATFRPVDDDPFLWFAQGEVWRVFTPALIHGHILHLLLNMQWFYFCGSVIERVRGAWRMAGLTILSAVVSNLAQYWWDGPLFCGISGVGYALYGYVWMKSLFQPETRFVVPASLHWMFWIWTLICFSGILPIANAAHAAGLAVGILYGLVPFL
jgi:GlpG protein